MNASVWRRLLHLSPGGAIALSAALPVALRLLLLPVLPVPAPAVADEFSYLLAADTFAHGRLTNPSPPLPEFFESFCVLVTPTYASMYQPGQGLFLAAGQVLLRLPWAGVVLSVALMCGAVTWLLLAWLPRRWAVAGGLSFALLYGIESYWMNSYWGGAVPAAGGALFLGGAARLLSERGTRRRLYLDSLLAGLGGVLLGFTRPWEGSCLGVAAGATLLVFSLRARRRERLLALLPAAAVILCAAGFLLRYNTRVTGSPLTSPYLLNLRRYFVAPLFVWDRERPALAYRHEVMREYYVNWRLWEQSTRNRVETNDPLTGFVAWCAHFKIVAGAAAAFLVTLLRAPRTRPRTFMLLLAAAMLSGLSLQRLRLLHYVAPGIGLLSAVILTGLRTLGAWRVAGRRLGRLLPQVVLVAAAAGFVRNTILTLGTAPIDVPERRAEVLSGLEAAPGRHLVFVRYGATHNVHQEWVYNGADLSGTRVLFARDISPAADERLLALEPGRRVWLLEPDRGDRLVPFSRR